MFVTNEVLKSSSVILGSGGFILGAAKAGAQGGKFSWAAKLGK